MKDVKRVKFEKPVALPTKQKIVRLTALFSVALCAATLAVGGRVYSAPVDVGKAVQRFLSSGALSGAKVGIEIRDAGSGQVLFSHNADRGLIPASNMKIVTIAAAMTLLRPEYRFKTEIYFDNYPRKGVVEGNIYLKGYGDPSLTDEQLWTVARDIAYRGVNQIKGKIIADDGYFDRVYFGEGWGKVEDDPYFAPISALSLNFNTFVVTANPAESPGVQPKLFYMPPDRHLKIVNRAITGSSGRAALKIVETGVEANSYDVIGSIPVGSKAVEVRRTVNDPGLYAVGSFEAYLNSWGIMTSGTIDRGAVPQTARLFLTRESKPLSEIAWDLGKLSSNFASELFIKTICAELGAEGERTPASTQCGVKVIAGYLEKLGVPKDSYKMMDGSGLSRLNRVTASQLNTALAAMYHDLKLWPEFAAALPIAGIDGTLEKRFVNSPLRGMVRAKTGHLNGVNSLSGYAPAKDGRMLIFSIIVNDFAGYHSSVEEVEESIVEAAAGY